MATAIIELFPSAYKATKLYSQLPTDGGGDFTFARSTTATRVNSEGIIETSAINIPRLDYFDQDDGCPVLLLEDAGTNLALQSETFDNASWTKTNVTVTANQRIAPDGNLTADQVFETAVTSNHYILQNIELTTSSKYTFSVYVKLADSNSPQFVQLTFDTVVFTSGFVNYDITNGLIITSSVHTGTIDLVDNGWARLTITAQAGEETAAFAALVFIDNDSGATRLPSYLGDTSASLLIWGAQLELFEFSSSYKVTTTATVTRNADTCNSSGTSSNFNSLEGVLYCKMAALFNDLSNRLISISDGTLSNRVALGFHTQTNTIVTFFVVGGVTQGVMSFVVSDITDLHKVAFKYAENDFSLWVDGVEVATDSGGIVFSADVLSTLRFENGDGSDDFYGKIKELKVFKTALSDAELLLLTT